MAGNSNSGGHNAKVLPEVEEIVVRPIKSMSWSSYRKGQTDDSIRTSMITYFKSKHFIVADDLIRRLASAYQMRNLSSFLFDMWLKEFNKGDVQEVPRLGGRSVSGQIEVSNKEISDTWKVIERTISIDTISKEIDETESDIVNQIRSVSRGTY